MQSVEHLTLGFGSGHNLWVMRSTPALGSVLSTESAWDSLSLSFCPSHLCALSRCHKFFDLTTFLDSLRRGGYLPNTGAQASISAPAYHGGCIVIPLPRHSRHLYFMTSYLQTGVSEKCLGLKLSVLSSCPWNSTQKDCWRGTHTFL